MKIRYLRSKSPYSSRDQAISALNKLNHLSGQPAVALYNDQSDSGHLKVLMAIGIADGVGVDNYRLISSVDNIEDLIALISSINTKVDNLRDNVIKNEEVTSNALVDLKESIDSIPSSIIGKSLGLGNSEVPVVVDISNMENIILSVNLSEINGGTY